jgi:carboxylesterase type B
MSQLQFLDYLELFLLHKDPHDKLNQTTFNRVVQFYSPSQPNGTYRQAASDLVGDVAFICNTLVAAGAAKQPVFVYRFNHRTSFTKSTPIPGVYHGLDLPYVFGTPHSYGTNFTAAESKLSNKMMRLWTNFATHLVPDVDEAFPKYNNSTRRNLVLQTEGNQLESGFRNHECDLWRSLWL